MATKQSEVNETVATDLEPSQNPLDIRLTPDLAIS